MDKLKKQRAYCRRYFTIAANEAEKAFSDDSVDIETSFDYLREKAELLFGIEAEIDNLLTSDENLDETEYFADSDVAESYRRRWISIKCKYEKLNKNDDASSSRITVKSCSSHSNDTKRRFRLPNLELRKFNGDISTWLSFWGQFSKIHEDTDIVPEDKFQYLIQATEPGSKARQLVESYPPSGQNYIKAIDQLKSRFARDEMLIENYVRNLIKLMLGRNDKSLRSLYDELTTQLQALESLNVTSDKYAAMLFPMIETIIPVNTLIAWERSNEKRDVNNLTGLLNFIKREVESEERIAMAKQFTNDESNFNLRNEPTSSCIIASENKEKSKERVCIWCEKNSHSSIECYTPTKLSLAERKQHLQKNRACFICLIKGHNAKNCRNFPKCFACMKRHTVVMCPNLMNKNVKKINNNVQNNNNEVAATDEILMCHSTTTIMQTLMVKVEYMGKSILVRALLDSGAQKSYIRRDVVNMLNIKSKDTVLLSHCLFGGVETSKESHNIFSFNLVSLDNQFSLSMSALDKKKISGLLPRVNNVNILDKLKELNIVINDVGYEPSEVSLLIGADYIGCLLTGSIVHLSNSLIAVETKLGWTVQGPISTHGNFNSSYLVNFSLPDIWELDCLGIRDDAEVETKVKKEVEIMNFFRKTVCINSEGRYEIKLLWKKGYDSLLNNKELAVRRLYSTTKRLETIGKIHDYNKIFEEWLQEGIIEIVTGDDSGHYMPHHAVIKESSTTTKIRPVSDASAKDKNGLSLNSVIEKGINLLEIIPRLLLQFRMYEIGITADIRKAFLQLSVAPEDRKYLQFLWWDSDRNNIVTYRYKRVVFGISCSPFLLAATIKFHLENVSEEFRPIASKLIKSFYVDNCVISVKTKEECDEFIKVSKKIMSDAKFDLRGWVTNLNNESNVISILGMMWETSLDHLYINPNFYDIQSECITKRYVLSYAQRIFDPVGFTCPVSLIPKLLLQKCWLLKLDWDKELPKDMVKEFRTWLNTLPVLNDIKIPRRLTVNNIEQCKLSLHIFCDASKSAYATCIFLRSEFNNNINVQLISAKARVSPTKTVTIPRLELIAAVIGVRLYKQVKEGFSFDCDVHFWTDSAVVLTWIKTLKNWSVFVKNRVTEINKFTNPDQWRHISGSLNPADLPSRGCNAKFLLNSRWWEGPQWLKAKDSEWPALEFVVNEDDVNIECREKVQCQNAMHTIERNEFIKYFYYFSSYSKSVRMLAWIYRFIFNCKYVNDKRCNELNFSEVKYAEQILFKLIQKEWLADTQALSKFNLEMFVDSDGITRIKTRLLLSNDSDYFKFPILLPGENVIIQRMIYEKHCKLQHAGTATVMSELRQCYWIVGGRKWVKRIIARCIICKKIKCKQTVVPVAPLPKDRITNAKVFEVTGTDLCGPLILNSGKKCWIVIFTCAVYRCVHFELTEHLSTESFIMALRRFIARRGRVQVIYSDNGSNFVGLNNLITSLDWDELKRFSTVKKFEWRFNVPTAAWWGGFWERLFGILKGLLRRILGNASLSYIELETLICDCEATINARPITYMSDETENLMPLTPACFLHDISDSNVDDLDNIDSNFIKVRYRYLQKLRSDFRVRFRNEYLSGLVHKTSRNATTTLKLGDIVLVESECKKQFWPIAIIVELFEGKDGIVRAAKVKTNKGSYMLRPVQKLYPLELSLEETEHLLKSKDVKDCINKNEFDAAAPVTTKSGRVVKKPEKLML